MPARDRHARDRPRTGQLLLADRHLDTPSRRRSADIPAGGRPPHARSPAPTEAHTRPREADHLALTDTPDNTVAAGEAARASRLAHNNSAICRLSNRATTAGRARL